MLLFHDFFLTQFSLSTLKESDDSLDPGVRKPRVFTMTF